MLPLAIVLIVLGVFVIYLTWRLRKNYNRVTYPSDYAVGAICMGMGIALFISYIVSLL